MRKGKEVEGRLNRHVGGDSLRFGRNEALTSFKVTVYPFTIKFLNFQV